MLEGRVNFAHVADRQLNGEILGCDLTLSFQGLANQCGNSIVGVLPCFPIVFLFTLSSLSSFKKIRMEVPKEMCLISEGNLGTQKDLSLSSLYRSWN